MTPDTTDWMITLNMTKLLAAFALASGPYATVAVHRLYGAIAGGGKISGPIRAWVAGLAIASLSKAIGVPLSMDLLTSWNPGTLAELVASGGITAMIATHLKNLSDHWKAQHPPGTPIGEAIRAVGGRGH